MSIFRRDPEPPTPSTPSTPSPQPAAPAPPRRPEPAPRRTATQIANGTRIKGEVTGTSDLVVDGALEGRVDLESDVAIGADGRIDGDVTARSVRIGGRVVGNVRGLERVEILPTGRLEGDVVAPQVVLAEGAFFKGKVEMTGTKGGGAAAPKRVEGGK